MTEIRLLVECVRTTVADEEALRLARALVDDLTPERASVAAEAKQVLAERDTLENDICVLEADSVARDG